MAALPDLLRHWARQSQIGKGIRLDAEQLDLLNAIGVGELIAVESARMQREQCSKRMMRSIPEENIGSHGIDEETEASERRSSRSSGTTTPQDVTAAAARAKRRCDRRFPRMGDRSAGHVDQGQTVAG